MDIDVENMDTRVRHKMFDIYTCMRATFGNASSTRFFFEKKSKKRLAMTCAKNSRRHVSSRLS